MPTQHAQHALSALEHGAPWRWIDLPIALVDVASEAWVVGLIALALFAWLEREVRDVLEVFLPFAVALAAMGAVTLLGPLLDLGPRSPGAAGHGVVPLLGHAFAGGQVGAAAVFATYALLVYGRRARPALLLALAVATARAVSGARWGVDLAVGSVAGALLGAVAYGAALRLSPRGHLARLRARRRPVA